MKKIGSQNIKANFKVNIYIKVAMSLSFILIEVFLLPKTTFASSISEERIIELTNITRNEYNVKSLTANQLLSKAAYEKCKDIFNEQIFQHNIKNKKFSDWIKNAGYEYAFVGENLAIDFTTSEGVIKAWLDSPTHKKNLINENFSEIGVAVIEGTFWGTRTKIIVQIFGSSLQNQILANTSQNYKNSNLFLLDDELISSTPLFVKDFYKISNNTPPCFLFNQELLCKTESDNRFVLNTKTNYADNNIAFKKQQIKSLIIKNPSNIHPNYQSFNFAQFTINYIFSLLVIISILFVSANKKANQQVKNLLLYYRKKSNIIPAKINR